MKILLCIPGFFLVQAVLLAQLPVGSWSDHLRYNTAINVAASSEEIFASTGSSIIIYNKAFNELKKLSTVNGLSETGISSISWSAENKILIIAYNSTNIDLLTSNGIYNIPDIRDKNIPGPKGINRIRTYGKYAYLCASFGVVVIDLVKNEIRDTWKPGPGPEATEVFDIAFGNNKVYAATGTGVWYGDASSQGLAYYGNWNQILDFPEPDARFTLLFFGDNRLFANMSPVSPSGDSIFASGGGVILISHTPGVLNRSFDPSPEGFIVSSTDGLRFFKSNGTAGSIISAYGWGNPDICQAVVENNNIWIADKSYGLIKGEGFKTFSFLSVTGPVTNSVSDISYSGGKTIICGGGISPQWRGLGEPLLVSVFENNIFTNISSTSIKDAILSCIDPLNSSHFFVSAWGDGLLEYRDNSLVNHFNSVNTPQLATNAGSSGIRICGLAMDDRNNLWIAQTGTSGSVKTLKSDGNWIVNPSTIDAPFIGDIICTRKGQKWIILPGGYGLFILDDNNTPEVFSDDLHKKMLITDTDGNVIPNTYSIAEDLGGNIWVGTDQGPVIYSDPDRALESDVKADRVKIPRDDGSGLADYMLGSETITSIAIDGANKKWLGTRNSGVYLLSPDGTRMIKNYNTHNSPLFSDSIASVAIDHKTGEVWFGTAKGVISIREIATEGNIEFSKVYAFPNPVRPDFTGNVTITGLMRDTRIKITDVSGNLVNEALSEGGQATWDLTTYNRKRVSTGVYIILCSSPDGSESAVTKILVMDK